MKYKQVFETVMDQSGVGPTLAAGPATAARPVDQPGADQFNMRMRAALTKMPIGWSRSQTVNNLRVHGKDPQASGIDQALGQQLQQVGGALINPVPSKV